MAITKDLGIVSAYGYAKSKGYTGTEEEFALLMADYAEVAGEAEAWAAGTKAGEPVPSTDPAYHNNAKYYADAAGDSASAAAGSASAAATDATDAHADAQSAATNAALAVNSATAAEASKNAAAGSATTASTKAGEASASATAAAGSATSAGQSAGTATTKAGEASASATAAAASAGAAASSVASIAHPYDATATYNIGDYVIYDGALYRCTTAIPTAEAWTAAHWTAATLADDVKAKANPDGFYENMSVGNAEQLLASVYETDKVPYLFRTSGGSLNIGDRETDELNGGSLAWNQLVQNGDFSDGMTGWTVGNGSGAVSDGVLTTTSTETVMPGNFYAWTTSQSQIVGHKYFAGCELKIGANNVCTSFRYGPRRAIVSAGTLSSTTWTRVASIFASIEASQTFIVTNDSNGDIGDTISIRNVNCIDLTLMFGSTIADYVYSLEQSTAGAGVVYFRKLFPKPYYAYDAGGLKSVKTSAHRMVGFNAYNDGEAKVVGGMQYQITGSFTAVSLDGEAIAPDADGYFTPSASGILSVTGGGATTCVHLVWDGERDGEYEPYKLNTYALDPDLELRGVFKLDANNSLYCDGDIYQSDGTVRRRYGIVDLGTLNWQDSESSATNPYFKASLSSLSIKVVSNEINYLCSKYEQKSVGGTNTNDKCVWIVSSPAIRIRDTSYSDVATFKAAMSGVYLIYELAEEIEETAEPYTNPQIVNDWGTEEYVDEREVAVPVGHVTQYMPDLKAKVEMSADSPDGNGDYILRHSNGLNAYVPLTKELPAAPSEDGTYTLSVTVSGGVATYSWVSAS